MSKGKVVAGELVLRRPGCAEVGSHLLDVEFVRCQEARAVRAPPQHLRPARPRLHITSPLHISNHLSYYHHECEYNQVNKSCAHVAVRPLSFAASSKAAKERQHRMNGEPAKSIIDPSIAKPSSSLSSCRPHPPVGSQRLAHENAQVSSYIDLRCILMK